MATENSITLVDTLPLLHTCLGAISDATSLAVDLEGVALCRSGTLCVVQLKALGSSAVWLVDVVVLKGAAFTEAAPNGISLKGILESRAVKKLFFDVRNDADALYHLFGVALANVYDVQLLEVAVRASNPGRPPRFLKGLLPSLESHVAPLKPAATVRQWARIKEAGLRLFAPERGGHYAVFEERPLARALQEYCAQDVALLHELDATLRGSMGPYGRNWEQRVVAESAVRVGVALLADYVPRGEHKALVPAIW
ncbi:ribonuclease H-like domain-containing protein [Mycena belliarum]|uniref:Ribonuclease H-like domain-containing protein n=1 Tax=Mycena belliarum TaxID=1033014 RepID=A0AAD6UEC0_9AGAR|nr:ribonuclease H-like domain-containing protein [Mycena belliae]